MTLALSFLIYSLCMNVTYSKDSNAVNQKQVPEVVEENENSVNPKEEGLNTKRKLEDHNTIEQLQSELLSKQIEVKKKKGQLKSGIPDLQVEYERLGQKMKLLEKNREIGKVKSEIAGLNSELNKSLVNFSLENKMLEEEEKVLQKKKSIAQLNRDLEYQEFQNTPGFMAFFGAFAAFALLTLIISLIPEKLTDFVKSSFGLSKKNTLAKIFGWKSYEELTKIVDTKILFILITCSIKLPKTAIHG